MEPIAGPGGPGMMEPLPPPDPGTGMEGMPLQALSPEPLPGELPAPIDPFTQALDSIFTIPPQDAVRRVYSLATSAARAKAKIRTRLDQMDARAYHAALSAAPEARYAADLTMARRELDVLAQERRRLTLEAVKARESGRPASIYELQAEAATRGMEAVALGVLLFLVMPEGLPATAPQQPGQPSQEIAQ